MNSNAALLVLVCGFASLYLEFLRPGLVFPAASGATLILLALASFSRLSVSVPGLAFISAAIILLLIGPATSRDVAVVVLAVMSMTSGLIVLVPSPHGIAPLAAATASGLLCPALELILISTVRARRNKRTL
jgi:membrane-bound ClpP family serine protease